MKFSNWNVGVRLAAGFATILVLLVITIGVGLTRMRAMNDAVEVALHDEYPKVLALYAIQGNLNVISRVTRNMVILTNPEEIAKEAARIPVARKDNADKLDYLDKKITSDQGRELLSQVKAVRLDYVKVTDVLVKRIADKQIAESKVMLMTELGPVQLAFFTKLDELIAFQNGLMEQSRVAVRASYDSAIVLMLGLLAAGIALGALIAWAVARSITRPLHQAVQVARRVAAGDLRSEIVIHSTDETGRLLAALRDMNANLSTIVGKVRSGTETVATASRQIASGNLDLSSRTEQQAASLEETASSMEELTATVRQNADNARQANSLASNAADVARKGGTVVANVVATMGSINDSSRKIVDIIAVIDGIAFQTNILALNAAVEAARAGEQGRGFAVVAAEVRSLAQRSAAAAKEIKTLIDDSVGKVDIGARLVDQAGATMDEIVESVKRVNDIMGEITAASQEQTAGLEQINIAITQMDEVTQQNAALVEQAAAAAESLQDQAATLSEVVSVFSLGDVAAVNARPGTIKDEAAASGRPGSGRAAGPEVTARTRQTGAAITAALVGRLVKPPARRTATTTSVISTAATAATAATRQRAAARKPRANRVAPAPDSDGWEAF